MALTLTMRQGHEFTIGDAIARVKAVASGLKFTLTIKGHDYIIDDKKWYEVLPQVKIQAGIPRNIHAKIVRVVIDAPKSIAVTYDKTKENR